MTAANLDCAVSPTALPAPAPAPGNDERLALRKKLGFGLGDFAFNLYWQATTLYLLYYYTDVLGLPPVTAGWIFGGALLWDALCDPVAGYIANRTRTRWGRYRPYLLFGSVPLALSFMAMFFPTNLQGTTLLALVLVTHMIFRTTYTVLSMPYNALMATLTCDSRERGSLAAYRMVCASAAGLVVALLTLKLVHVFGMADQKRGFFVVMALYAVASIPVFLLTFFSTQERVQPDSHGITIREALATVAHNLPFLLACGITVAIVGAGTFFSKTLPYVMKYGLHREDLIGPALGTVAVQVFIAIPFWAWVMRRTSKRFVAMAGGCLGICGYAALGAIGMPSISVFFILIGLIGFSIAAALLSMWAMVPDTVEYGEWRTGIRGEGTIFGVFSFAHKVALAMAVGGVGHMLGAVDFVANRSQAQSTIDGIWAMLWQGPMIFLGISVGLAFLYPLSPGKHRKILEALHQRRAARTPSN